MAGLRKACPPRSGRGRSADQPRLHPPGALNCRFELIPVLAQRDGCRSRGPSSVGATTPPRALGPREAPAESRCRTLVYNSCLISRDGPLVGSPGCERARPGGATQALPPLWTYRAQGSGGWSGALRRVLCARSPPAPPTAQLSPSEAGGGGGAQRWWAELPARNAKDGWHRYPHAHVHDTGTCVYKCTRDIHALVCTHARAQERSRAHTRHPLPWQGGSSWSRLTHSPAGRRGRDGCVGTLGSALWTPAGPSLGEKRISRPDCLLPTLKSGWSI